jgi:hypothetical protein
MENFINLENELKKNIDILENTFSKFGLELVNVGAQYANMVGGKGIKFFCEIMSNADMPEDEHFHVKINVYDSKGSLISMGQEKLNTKDFTGYDTLCIAVFHDTIHYEVTKARIYLTK